ncbi:MAG: sugar phosphate nucleotidyltransferase [Candidatus Aenigmatarchaeota archaeon]
MIDAVILAAGKSVRMHPLTLAKPKPMLKIANRPLLHWTLANLQGIAKRVFIVVGYMKEKISVDGFNLDIKFVEQKGQLGTAHALAAVEKMVGERFLVLPGDDLFGAEDIRRVVRYKLAVLAKETDRPWDFGIVEMERGKLKHIEEKPKEPKSRLANTGCYVLDRRIFPCIKRIKASPRGELELTDAINEFAKSADIEIVNAREWIPITYPWDLLKANAVLLDRAKPRIDGKIERGVTVKGKLILGKGSTIRAGSYIEGPVMIGDDCIVGPNSFLRPYTCIGNGCKIGNAVEIKNSIIGNNSFVSHLSYVGDSVLGDSVNCGAGTITANLRHDGKNVKTRINGKMVDTGLRKFGTVIGDDVKTGIHTAILPGRKIWPGRTTMPAEVVEEDKID